LNLAPLAWVALVPVLTLVRSAARPRTVYLAAWLCGLGCFVPALQWLRVADPRMYFTWAGLALYCSAYLPLAVFLLRRLDRALGPPLALTVPLVWVPLEWLRGHFGGGFPWYFLGHSQHGVLPVIQVADLGGAFAVSALVAAVNGALADWLTSHGVNPRGARRWATAVVALLVVASLGYGCWRRGQSESAPGPGGGLVQGTLPQQLKDERSEDTASHFRRLGDRAAAAAPRPDLVVWPETSYVPDWYELAPGARRDRLTDLGRSAVEGAEGRLRENTARWGVPALLGLNTNLLWADGRVDRFNSALLAVPPGRVAGRYDKIHCVPFGEYVPFRDTLPWMQRFAPYDSDY